MREIELERSTNRMILQKQFNGDPPFDEATAEENGVTINRNFLKGVQVLADARRQWNQAFLSTPHYYALKTDSGPVHKREAWGSTVTTQVSKLLKRSRGMIEQSRATGANVILHGIAPVTWKDRKAPLPVVLPVDSVYIPTQTEIDFENLPYFALYRELTPFQLSSLVEKEKNPGWNKKLAKLLIKRKLAEDSKDASAYTEISAERVEEIIKQDGGYWDSDAVPTIDCLDFYFREGEDGEGWYRRIVLDWDSETIAGGDRPERSWGKEDSETDPDKNFLYSSGSRPYCDFLSEVLHVQFGDCSAYAPFKYHSVRSLGWLLWGVCDLMNRMECRFFEAVFENLMWFFRASGENDMNRLKKAVFQHMGVIPNGVNFIPAQDRFVPNAPLIDQARGSLRSQIAETAASYTHDFDKGETSRELTATETMARVNSINALLAGMMTLAYNYEEFKYSEITRRIMDEDHPQSVKIREACMREGVPENRLKSEYWQSVAERVIGAGNKTVEMAAVSFLQSIRANLPPQSQRKVDHISIRAVTDQPDLADDLAPLEEEKASQSTQDAERATSRLLMGLQLTPTPAMVPEDYVVVWLKDLAQTVEKAVATGMASIVEIGGMKNLASHIGAFLEQMGQNPTEKPKVTQYLSALGQIMNHVKALEKQAMEQAQAASAGGNGEAAAEVQKLQAQAAADAQKQEAAKQSHAQKTAQRQVQFEMEQNRKDQENQAAIQRQNEQAAANIAAQQVETAAKAAAQAREQQNQPQKEE